MADEHVELERLWTCILRVVDPNSVTCSLLSFLGWLISMNLDRQGRTIEASGRLMVHGSCDCHRSCRLT